MNFKGELLVKVFQAVLDNAGSLSAIKTIFGIGNVPNDVVLAHQSAVVGGTIAVALGSIPAGTTVTGFYDATETSISSDGLTVEQADILRSYYLKLIYDVIADATTRQSIATSQGITLAGDYTDFLYIQRLAYDTAMNMTLNL